MATIKTQIAQVANFMKVAGQETHTTSVAVSLGVAKLRHTLITEEISGKNEFAYCAERDDLVGMLDGMCDILYVVYGAALTFGVDITGEYSSLEDRTAPNKANGTLARANDTLKTIHNLEYDASQFQYGYTQGYYSVILSSLALLVQHVYDYAELIQVDLDGAFNEVHKSNMSKFASTKEEAEASVAARKAQGDSKYDEVYVAGVVVDGVEHWMIKRTEDHKILKCMSFFEPDLSKFVK